jgi:predicted ATPase
VPTTQHSSDRTARATGGRTRPCRVLALEGMPGAGKTTLADQLDNLGHAVVPEYAAVDGSAIDQAQHPDVDHDDAHQRNWLRKHQLIATRATTHATRSNATGLRGASGGVAVWVDRDWITSLAYAHSLIDDEPSAWALMADRIGWAQRHLQEGRLAVATAYLVLLVDPGESLRRRRGHLDPAHPWSRPRPLARLEEFYRDPAGVIGKYSADLADVAAAAVWVHLDHPTRKQALAAAADLLHHAPARRI